MKKRGFTLIELLIVIAIVVMLIAIIWPIIDRMGGSNQSTTISTDTSSFTQESSDSNAGRFEYSRHRIGKGLVVDEVLVIKDTKTGREYIGVSNYNIIESRN